MTEEEAKKKWCPMTRAHITVSRDYYGTETAEGPAVNKHTKDAYCIGSACMMFRAYQINAFPGPPETICYCGLGGRP